MEPQSLMPEAPVETSIKADSFTGYPMLNMTAKQTRKSKWYQRDKQTSKSKILYSI